jgi:hypothetical protein
MKTKTLILFVALTGLIMTSCGKSDPIDTKATDAADDVALSEALYDDAFASLEISTVFAEVGKKSASILDSCPVITFNSPGEEFFPINIVIDYGIGCTGLFDVERSGKILITLSGPRGTAGSERVLTFDNYVVNGAKVEGTFTVENLGMNNNQNAHFAVSLEGGKITFPDSKVITREFSREREYVAGYGTWSPWDDECLITGTSSGTNLNGKTYSLTITNPLEWAAACRFLVGGTIRFEVDGIEPFELDYGTGECDAVATLSRGDESKEITLRYWHPKYHTNR